MPRGNPYLQHSTIITLRRSKSGFGYLQGPGTDQKSLNGLRSGSRALGQLAVKAGASPNTLFSRENLSSERYLYAEGEHAFELRHTKLPIFGMALD